MSTKRKVLGALAVLGLGGVIASDPATLVSASSHREAPAIAQDPAADLTDLYAFNSPDDPNSVTLVMNAIPFQQPGGGPNFYRFGDDVAYQFNIDNNGDSVPDLEYQFRFSTSIANKDTFLYNTNQVTSNDDPDLNIKQVYSITETKRTGLFNTQTRTIARNLPVPPANVGARSTPDYEANLGAGGVQQLADGIKAFAGPRDDPFFADLGSIFDLAGLRPLNPAHLIPLPAADGVDGLAGLNVHSIAIQIPKSRLVKGDEPVIGVYASTLRRAVTVRDFQGGSSNFGFWIQTSRLGQPLVNEVIVPLGAKDRFNASLPFFDNQFAPKVLNPELGGLIELLYPGVNVPEEVDTGLGLGGREDLATIFLTGIPGVNQPKNVRPAELLRLNTTSPVSTFPNGRWLADDVVDIELQAVAGATAFTPEFNIAPNNLLGDGVDANDREFTGSFPYLASPFSGYDAP